MNTRRLVFLSLLVGMGAVLHQIMPPIYLGMKPDLMLLMMFLGIMLFPERKYVLLVGIVAGIIAALTTTFPMGQIPNIIDKLVAAFAFYGLYKVVQKTVSSKHHTSLAVVGVLTAIGIIISGTVFLGTALFLTGTLETFFAFFVSVVLPTTVMGTIAMIIIYPIAKQIMSRTKVTVNA